MRVQYLGITFCQVLMKKDKGKQMKFSIPPKHTIQGSNRNSKTQFHDFSMINHDQQCNFHDYLMHGLQPPL